jgi:integrase
LRWSEAVALTVDDIRDDRIWINKSVHGQTKSKAGIRSVPLVSPFKIFPKSPKTLRKVLKPYGVDIHSLRHTYAYLLKQQGVHVTTAQRLLGHSDPRVTMNVYTQVLDNEIDDVGLLLSKAAGF